MRCPHGLIVSTCALCGLDRRMDDMNARGLSRVATTQARYAGKCPGCGDQITVGDTIYLVDGAWVDESCA